MTTRAIVRILRQARRRSGCLWKTILCLPFCIGLVGPAAAQVEPPRRWSFTASGNAHELVPAATPDGGVVVLAPERLSAAGIRQAPPRVQKIHAAGALAWERDLTWPGIGWPVVREDGAILAAAGDLPAQAGQLHCLEPDGSERWVLNLGTATPTAAPAVRPNGRIWLPVWRPPNAELLQITPAGQIEWRREFGWTTLGPGVAHPDGQQLMLSGGSGLLALNDDGTTRWSLALQAASGNPPALSPDGTIVVTASAPHPMGMFWLINPDGSVRHVEQVQHWLLAPVVDADGTIYLTRGDGRLEVRDRLGALVRSINLPAPPAGGAVLAGDGRPWVSLRSGWVAGYGPDGTPAVLVRGGGNRDVGGAPLLIPGEVFVAGFTGRQLIAFEGVGTPSPGAWPMLAGNPSRDGRYTAVFPPPPAPGGLTATIEGEGARVRWEPVPGLVTYEVWRGAANDLATAVRLAFGLTDTEWRDPGFLMAETEYRYWVRARGAAEAGAFSAPVPVRREPPPVGGRIARLKLAAQLTSAPAQGPDGTLYVGDAGGLLAVAPDGSTRWRFDAGMGDGSVGTPVVLADGRVVFTAHHGTGATTNGSIVAVSPQGAELWRLPWWQHSRVPPSSPAVDAEGHLLVAGMLDDHDWLLRVTPDGAVQWTNWLGNLREGFGSVVIAGDGSFWLGTPSGVSRWAPDGRLLWSHGQFNTPQHSPAALDFGGELLSASEGGLGGVLRLRTDGRPGWRAVHEGIGGGVVVDADGTSYFGSLSGNVHAVTRAGEVRWSVPAGAWLSCTPALGEPGLVYAANLDGRLLALNRADGAERWRFELGAAPVAGLVPIEIAGQPELAVATADGVLHRLRVEGGPPADAPWPMLGRDAAHHGRLPAPLPALTAPAALTATDSPTNADVALRWEPVPGAGWYEVFRAPQPDLAAALPLATNIVRTTEHADATTPPDVPFWYWVRAAGVDGPGPWSGPVRGLQGSRLWQVRLPFTAYPTPAVAADGTAYVLVRGPQGRVTLLALAREDGRERWRAEVGQALGGVPFPAPPVLTEDGRIIVSGQQALACFSPAGERLWEQEGSRCLAVGPMALTRSGLLVMTTAGSLLARRITDGEILWDLTFNPSGNLSPVVGPDGTIWACRSLGGMMALRPDGTTKILTVPVNPSWQPAMTAGGELLATDQNGQLRVVSPEGGVISFGAGLRSMAHPVSPAPGQVGFALRATPTELILGTTATQVVARLPGGWSAGAGHLALAQAADGTWYVADSGQVRVLRPNGETAAVWPVLNRPPGGIVIGDDGTLYVQQLQHLSAFRGGSPPAPDAWAMLLKDRRNSASWETGQLPAPEPPAGFEAAPNLALNRAILQWQRPSNLAVLEIWRAPTDDFAAAVRLHGPFTGRTNYVDTDRAGGSTAHYWLRVLDLAGAEVGRVGPVLSATPAGPAPAWSATVPMTAGGLALAEDGTLYQTWSGLRAFAPDGTVRWTLPEVSGTGYPMIAPDEAVLVWQGLGLTAVHPTGVIRWQRSLADSVPGIVDMAVSDQGQIVAVGSFGIRALDLAGNLRWFVWDEPYVTVALDADQSVYATTLHGRQVRCFSPAGELRWTAGPGVFGGGLALSGPGELLAPGSDAVLRRFNPHGEVAWSRTLDAGAGEPLRLVHGLLVATSANQLLRLDPAGDTTAQTSLVPGPMAPAEDGTVLVGSRGRLMAVDAGGAVQWTYELPRTNDIFYATLLAPDGRIILSVRDTIQVLQSTLRPAATGWHAQRANPRRTGQWLPPGDVRPRLMGIARRGAGELVIGTKVPTGLAADLEHTADWQTWLTVGQVQGYGIVTNIAVPRPDTPVGAYRLRARPGP